MDDRQTDKEMQMKLDIGRIGLIGLELDRQKVVQHRYKEVGPRLVPAPAHQATLT